MESYGDIGVIKDKKTLISKVRRMSIERGFKAFLSTSPEGDKYVDFHCHMISYKVKTRDTHCVWHMRYEMVTVGNDGSIQLPNNNPYNPSFGSYSDP